MHRLQIWQTDDAAATLMTQRLGNTIGTRVQMNATQLACRANKSAAANTEPTCDIIVCATVLCSALRDAATDCITLKRVVVVRLWCGCQRQHSSWPTRRQQQQRQQQSSARPRSCERIDSFASGSTWPATVAVARRFRLLSNFGTICASSART